MRGRHIATKQVDSRGHAFYGKETALVFLAVYEPLRENAEHLPRRVNATSTPFSEAAKRPIFRLAMQCHS